MVYSQHQRVPLLPGLNSSNTGCFSDAAFRVAAEVCEEFYDTFNFNYYKSKRDWDVSEATRRRSSSLVTTASRSATMVSVSSSSNA